MKKLHLLFIIGILISNLVGAQNIDIQSVQPNLKSMDAISAFYEVNDIAYYSDIVNTPQKALEYEDDKKVAANMGVYLADMIYGIGAKSLKANESFGAVMELSRKLGLEEQFTQLIIDRINSKEITATQASLLMNDVLKGSDKEFSESQRTEIFNFILYGNYIEKLYQISSVLRKAEMSDLPESAKANLNRTLLVLMAKQGKPLSDLSKLMVDYSSTLVAHRDIRSLLKSYESLAANALEIVKLPPAEIYNHKTIKDIHKQVGTIRTRIVE